jgi:hypothetical protein
MAAPTVNGASNHALFFEMLIVAFIVLGIAVLIGSVLGLSHLRTEGIVAPPWRLAALHGLVAIAGFGCLLLALEGPPRGLETDTAAFGAIAAVLFSVALLCGIAVLVLRLFGKRRMGALIGIHATLAVAGFVVLIVYVFP